jgi:hypothetical protein
MKPAERKRIPTVSEAVASAAVLCDPAGHDTGVIAFIESYEDDDRLSTAVEDLGGELGSVAGGIDPEGDSPAVDMTAATAFWLATNFDRSEDRERALREAARLAFGDGPPERVVEWLAGEGVKL